MNNQRLQKSKQGIHPPSPIVCGIHKTWWQNTWGSERLEVLQKEFSVRQGWLRPSKKDACSHRDYITKEFKDGCFHDCGSKTLQTISLSPSVQALGLPSSLESRRSLQLLQISRRKKKDGSTFPNKATYSYVFFSALLPFKCFPSFKHENIDKTASFRVVLSP